MKKTKESAEANELAVQNMYSNLDQKGKNFIMEMATVAEMSVDDFLKMLSERDKNHQQQIFCFASKDGKYKIYASKEGKGTLPKVIKYQNRVLLNTNGFNREDIDPTIVFFIPTESQLKKLPKEQQKAIEEGGMLFRKIDQRKFSQTIKMTL